MTWQFCVKTQLKLDSHAKVKSQDKFHQTRLTFGLTAY